MLKLSPHVRAQMSKRGVLEEDVREAVEYGEVIIEEINGRIGTKRYSRMKGLEADLIVIWFYNKAGDKEVVTVYWRRRK